MTMPDLERLVRHALGDPPPDPAARERALVRLRAVFDATRLHEVEASDGSPRAGRLRIAAVFVAVLTLLLSVVGTSSTDQRAAAAGLERLAEVNMGLSRDDVGTSIRIEEQYPLGRTSLPSGQSFTVIVRSTVTRTLASDGSLTLTEIYRSISFATETDRATWESVGSPQLPAPGDRRVERLTRRDTEWFDVGAISTDPDLLLEQLEDGSVAPRYPDPSELFILIGNLLAEPGVAPAQRAALYRAAASLEGVKAVGTLSDPLGRIGEGYELAHEGRTEVLIFDPDTGQPLAASTYAAGSVTGQPSDWMAFEYPGP
jgi:hypothetical protein